VTGVPVERFARVAADIGDSRNFCRRCLARAESAPPTAGAADRAAGAVVATVVPVSVL
jgi:hypothetical protein